MDRDNFLYDENGSFMNQGVIKKRNLEDAHGTCTNSAITINELCINFMPNNNSNTMIYNNCCNFLDNTAGKRRKVNIDNKLETDSSNDKNNMETYLLNVDADNDVLKSNLNNLVEKNVPHVFTELPTCYPSSNVLSYSSAPCASNPCAPNPYASAPYAPTSYAPTSCASTSCASNVSSALCFSQNGNQPNKNIMGHVTSTEVYPFLTENSSQSYMNKKELGNLKKKKNTHGKNKTSKKEVNSRCRESIIFQDGNLSDVVQHVLKAKALDKKLKSVVLQKIPLELNIDNNVKCALKKISEKQKRNIYNVTRQVFDDVGNGTVQISVYNDVLLNNEENVSDNECDSSLTTVNNLSDIPNASFLQFYNNNVALPENNNDRFWESDYKMQNDESSFSNFITSSDMHDYQNPQDSQNTQDHQNNQHTQSTQTPQTNGYVPQNNHSYMNSVNMNYANNSFSANANNSFMPNELRNRGILHERNEDNEIRNSLGFIHEEQTNRNFGRRIDFVNFHNFVNVRRTHADHPYIFGDEDVYGNVSNHVNGQLNRNNIDAATSTSVQTSNEWNPSHSIMNEVVNNVVEEVVNPVVNLDTGVNGDLNNMMNHVEMNGDIDPFYPNIP